MQGRVARKRSPLHLVSDTRRLLLETAFVTRSRRVYVPLSFSLGAVERPRIYLIRLKIQSNPKKPVKLWVSLCVGEFFRIV